MLILNLNVTKLNDPVLFFSIKGEKLIILFFRIKTEK